METPLLFPRIIYHFTEGRKTDYGYCYEIAHTPGDFEKLKKQGWVLTISELGEPFGPTVSTLVSEPTRKHEAPISIAEPEKKERKKRRAK